MIEYNTIFEGARDISYFPLVQSSPPLQCKRTQICSDVRIYMTKYKATLKALAVFCHAQPQYPVHCKNMLFRYPILCSNMTVHFLLDFFFFFCFSIKICLKEGMNESGFTR